MTMELTDENKNFIRIGLVYVDLVSVKLRDCLTSELLKIYKHYGHNISHWENDKSIELVQNAIRLLEPEKKKRNGILNSFNKSIEDNSGDVIKIKSNIEEWDATVLCGLFQNLELPKDENNIKNKDKIKFTYIQKLRKTRNSPLVGHAAKASLSNKECDELFSMYEDIFKKLRWDTIELKNLQNQPLNFKGDLVHYIKCLEKIVIEFKKEMKPNWEGIAQILSTMKEKLQQVVNGHENILGCAKEIKCEIQDGHENILGYAEEIKCEIQDGHERLNTKMDKILDAIYSNSAFSARAASKAPSLQQNGAVTHTEPVKEPPNNNKKKKNNQTNKQQSTTQSKKKRQVAEQGYQMAISGDYHGAVKMYSKAIQLDPSDFRLFGNRSSCYDRIEKYDSALKDADSAINLAPGWPEGYFHKGRALTGLKRFQEAEQVFQQVLKLGAVCKNAEFELVRVRVQILIDMGFTQQLSEQAVRTYGTVKQALKALLAGKVSDEEDSDNPYLSDEDIPTQNRNIEINIQNKKTQKNIQTKQPEPKCTTLWVGNVDPQMVTEEQMIQLFSKCGIVSSVRIQPHKYCAFVNYNDSQSVMAAMEKLQGAGLGNQKLLLRFPNGTEYSRMNPVRYYSLF